jgi:hypothetical protein
MLLVAVKLAVKSHRERLVVRIVKSETSGVYTTYCLSDTLSAKRRVSVK